MGPLSNRMNLIKSRPKDVSNAHFLQHPVFISPLNEHFNLINIIKRICILLIVNCVWYLDEVASNKDYINRRLDLLSNENIKQIKFELCTVILSPSDIMTVQSPIQSKHTLNWTR